MRGVPQKTEDRATEQAKRELKFGAAELTTENATYIRLLMNALREDLACRYAQEMAVQAIEESNEGVTNLLRPGKRCVAQHQTPPQAGDEWQLISGCLFPRLIPSFRHHHLPPLQQLRLTRHQQRHPLLRSTHRPIQTGNPRVPAPRNGHRDILTATGHARQPDRTTAPDGRSAQDHDGDRQGQDRHDLTNPGRPETGT